MTVDALLCLILKHLRIPRLHYSMAIVTLQVLCLWFFDGVMFGGIRVRGLR